MDHGFAAEALKFFLYLYELKAEAEYIGKNEIRIKVFKLFARKFRIQITYLHFSVLINKV